MVDERILSLPFKSFFDSAATGLALADRRGNLLVVNPAFLRLIGGRPQEINGRNILDFVAPEKAGEMSDMLHGLATDLHRQCQSEIVLHHGRGHVLHTLFGAALMQDKTGAPLCLMFSVSEMPAGWPGNDAAPPFLPRDPITGLYTRGMFMERLQHAASRAEREAKKHGVLVLDMDRFKEINDYFGHGGGDDILKEVGERLTASLRKSDTVARLEGDCFAVLLEGLNKSEQVLGAVQKLLDAFAAPFLKQGQDIYLTPSIGISVSPEDGVDGGSLVKNAQIAMRIAKKGGGNAFQFYTQEINNRAIERIRLDGELRHALKHGQFVIYYQPLVNASDGKTVCLEALLRWNHPKNGLMPPMSFIPLLEETGLIEQAGNLVLHAACRQIKALRLNGHGSLRTAVNISARQFLQKDFAVTIEKILQETGADPQALELEITESVLLKNTETVGRILASIVALGVSIALDDFGTGCSSLSYLKHFPIHTLKIDRNFVHGLPRQRGDRAITNAIIALAHDLGLKVIAEGVETEEQYAYLREQRCHELQGFLFSRPLPADEIGPWLTKQLH